jgi:hypothetical protein
MSDAYAIKERIGCCQVCGREDDLRFGVCFSCADFVDGEQISATTHRLWDQRNPSNQWFASIDGVVEPPQ